MPNEKEIHEKRMLEECTPEEMFGHPGDPEENIPEQEPASPPHAKSPGFN